MASILILCVWFSQQKEGRKRPAQDLTPVPELPQLRRVIIKRMGFTLSYAYAASSCLTKAADADRTTLPATVHRQQSSLS